MYINVVSGWLETRLAQITLNYLKLYYVCCMIQCN